MVLKEHTRGSYNFSRHLIPFMSDAPFYAEISRHVQKRCTRDIPTLAVTYDKKTDEIVLWYNDEFMSELTDWETRGAITHEFDHLVFGHLNERKNEPADDWNIGTDLAINSLYKSRAGLPKNADPNETYRCLPKIALIPGEKPYIDPEKFKKLQPFQQKACTKLSELIERLPPEKSSEYYFHRVLEDKQKNGYGSGDVELVLGPMDDHNGWSGGHGDENDQNGNGEGDATQHGYIEAKVKSIIEKAVRVADSRSNGWGSIPAELRDSIRRSVSTIINWRSVLRQFVGSIVRGARTSSIKRINRRYPYIHPGVKKGYTAKLLVAIDESGSVDNDMLEMFFAELDSLTRKVDITLLHFDCSCTEKDLFEWKKGARPKLERVRAGGTNFDAPTALVNDPKNRGRWDGMLIMTDGQAPAPAPSRIKRGWVLGQGCNLIFPSDETQIFLSKDTQVKGAWR